MEKSSVHGRYHFGTWEVELGHSKVVASWLLSFVLFRRAPTTLGKCSGPLQNTAEPRRTLEDTPAQETGNPSERQVSSESLTDGCAPRMVTLRNSRRNSSTGEEFAGPEKLGLAPKVLHNLWGSGEPFFNRLVTMSNVQVLQNSGEPSGARSSLLRTVFAPPIVHF